jgi:HEAT repeat protein
MQVRKRMDGRKNLGISILFILLQSLAGQTVSAAPNIQENPQALSQQQDEGIILINESSPVEDLVKALQHSSLKYQRKYAAEILGERKEVGAVPFLVQSLEDPEDIVKKAAAEALAKIGDRTVFQQLLANMAHSSPSVREYSAYVLGRLAKNEDTTIVQALEGAAGDQDKNVRIEIIYALYEIGASSSKFIFINGLMDSEPRIRSYCANALGNLRVSESGAALSAALDRETDENVMRMIVSAMGKIGGNASARTLAEAVTNETPSLRADIADALGEIKTPEATRALIELLADDNPKVRARAAIALAGGKDPASIGPLANALKDRSVMVRQAVSEALIYTADSSVIGELVGALGDPDPVVGDNVAEALIRVNDLDAVHALIQSLSESNPVQRSRALAVLAELTHRPYGSDVAKWMQWYEENFKSSE